MTDWLKRVPIAHRGLHDEAAGLTENALSAFAAAMEAGYAIECDLRLSRDGEVVIFHDATLERLTSLSGAVQSYSAKQLGQMTLRGGADRIPSLGALLGLAQSRVPLLLELKRCDAPPGVLETRVADLLADYTGPAAVQSFDPDILTWFRAHAPGIPRGLLARAEQDLLTPAIVAAQFIAYDVAALPAFGPAFARRIGLPVIAWTVRDEHTRSIAAQHADNIIFEGIRPKIPGGA
jgi:glycerophosphoryl diester phosphodiesterase